jgi:acyl-CoA synthetase (AMP-forming)/AMP-acid ligase II/1-acyl-sn-glycerol-3-phosphate acyltransferase/acyl carrier protein
MIAGILKALLSLRYRVTIEGLDKIDRSRGVLILPNHPAEIDPVILTAHLWSRLHPRPVVIEGMYKLPFLNSILRRIRAIPIADMDFDSGPYKRRRIERSLSQIVSALREGDNVLIYPSGRLSVTGEEKLGAASGVYSILREYPNAHIAIVRIRGLYGSIFSKAPTGGITPDVGSTFLNAVKILLKNGIFFTPRREVSIEIDFDPPDLPKDQDPLALNRYLEARYNAPQPETPILVSHSRLSYSVPEIPTRRQLTDDIEQIPETLRERVIAQVAHVSQTPTDKISIDTKLGDDLGIDSLSMAELLLWLDREFEAHDIELSELVTVGSLMRAAAGQLGSATPRADYIVPEKWAQSIDTRPEPTLPQADSIARAFLLTCERLGDHTAVGDARSGVITWGELRLRAIILARQIAKLPGHNIGVLLPASVASAVVTIACLIANKVPTFLNWTSGKRSLLHSCELTDIKAIITAESFLDIIQTDLEFLEHRFVLLEDIAKKITLSDKLSAKILATKSASAIEQSFDATPKDPHKPAVVLFTSGSEALPKGVPLSHHNIITNVKGVLDAFQIKRHDVLLGFLPPFHSFGLTICSILPLITGLRVAYYPNPNESRRIAKAIGSWGATIAAGTPTFLRSVLKAGATDQFDTLRALVSGAERAPQELFELAKTINSEIEILEGYGITECSPVVSVGRPHEPRVGVGRPIAGVSIAIVHPETRAQIPDGAQGLILIRGDNVFAGYLDPQLDPFIEYQGQRWYNSGDLGRIENGSLVITGRLKRFIKIAGEMVSLGAVEEALQKVVPSPDGAQSVAVVTKGTEGDGRPRLIAFVAGKLSAESANEHLKQAGFPNLVHITESRELKNLPVLGSGKTDYQTLQSELN